MRNITSAALLLIRSTNQSIAYAPEILRSSVEGHNNAMVNNKETQNALIVRCTRVSCQKPSSTTDGALSVEVHEFTNHTLTHTNTHTYEQCTEI